jgi:hypothetical protein
MSEKLVSLGFFTIQKTLLAFVHLLEFAIVNVESSLEVLVANLDVGQIFFFVVFFGIFEKVRVVGQLLFEFIVHFGDLHEIVLVQNIFLGFLLIVVV